MTIEQVEHDLLRFELDAQELCADCQLVSACVCVGLRASGWGYETKAVRYSPHWVCWKCLGAGNQMLSSCV